MGTCNQKLKQPTQFRMSICVSVCACIYIRHLFSLVPFLVSFLHSAGMVKEKGYPKPKEQNQKEKEKESNQYHPDFQAALDLKFRLLILSTYIKVTIRELTAIIARADGPSVEERLQASKVSSCDLWKIKVGDRRPCRFPGKDKNSQEPLFIAFFFSLGLLGFSFVSWTFLGSSINSLSTGQRKKM